MPYQTSPNGSAGGSFFDLCRRWRYKPYSGLGLRNTWLEYYRIDIDADGMAIDTLLDYVKMLGGKE